MWLTAILLVLLVNQLSISQAKKPRSSPDRTFCKTRSDGLYPAPSSCKRFMHCHHGRTAYKKCPPGTLFNPAIKVCDWPRNVKCGAVQPQVPKVPSQPRALTLTAINATTVKMSWRKPRKFSKHLLHYVINITKSGSQSTVRFTVHAIARSHTQIGLVPGSKYVVQIHAVNKAGEGQRAIATVTTPFEIPPPPSSLSGKALGPTAISLRWKDPNLENDSILTYVITYGVAGLEIGQSSLHLHGYANTAVLTNLLPGVEYGIKIQAISFGGFGKPSTIKVFTSFGDFCPPGHYSNTGKQPCQKCIYGRYQEKIGRKICTQCRHGTITLIKGATSITDCQKVTSA